ncbi:hypothetical protein FACS189465_3650 [Clostridia bacterium]|nr:hypothetical protein FACS189465_3650 [Clostridia bacterium]
MLANLTLVQSVQKEDVYIQKNGKIIAVLSKPQKERKSLLDFVGILEGKVSQDITMKQIKEERLEEQYGIQDIN